MSIPDDTNDFDGTMVSAIYDNIDSAIFLIKVAPDGRLVFLGLNPAHEKLTGLSSKAVAGSRPANSSTRIPRRRWNQTTASALARSGLSNTKKNWQILGKTTWWHTRLIPVKGPTGEVALIIGAATDVSMLKKAEQEARRQGTFLTNILDGIPYPVYYTDESYKLTGFNEQFRTVFGIHQKRIEQFVISNLAIEGQRDEFAASLIACENAEPGKRIQVRCVTGGGEARDFLVQHRAFLNQQGSCAGAVGILVDITDRVRMESALSSLAMTDELSGLYNRRGFRDLALRAWRTSCRADQPISALMIDIDHFKEFERPVRTSGWRRGHSGRRARDRVLGHAARRPGGPIRGR